jgi:heme-degrading protein
VAARLDWRLRMKTSVEVLMISLNDAKQVISAAENKAGEIGQPMNIAVADAGGNLIAHVRMDGAWLGSVYCHQQGLYGARFRHRNKGSGCVFPTRWTIFRNPCVQPWQSDDLCRRDPAQARRPDRWYDRRQRRLRRTGSEGCRSWCGGLRVKSEAKAEGD